MIPDMVNFGLLSPRFHWTLIGLDLVVVCSFVVVFTHLSLTFYLSYSRQKIFSGSQFISKSFLIGFDF